MDPLKEAFQKVRNDMDFLYKELSSLSEEFKIIKKEISSLNSKITLFSENFPIDRQTDKQTNRQEIKTFPTHSSTDNYPPETLRGKNIPFSTGNEGVPTDRQTDKQTDNKPEIFLKTPKNSIDDAIEILDSLDNIKKEIRLKFKRLTDQELLVFSTLYQLEEEVGPTDYKTLSSKLKLSESSIRDYVGRLIKKGIPVDKKRVNNKTILLSISQNLKKIASLPTILQLRDL